MNRTRILLTTIILLSAGEQAQAEQTGPGVGKDDIGINLNTRFVSKHIWRGFDQFDDKGAVQPSINLDWFGTGFSTTVWSCWELSSGSENQEEMDYVAAYSSSFLQDAPLRTNYSVNWIYYDYPNTYSKHKDAQEIGVSLSWPNLIAIGDRPLVPSYYVGRLWPSKSGGDNRSAAGWIHIFGLGYDLPVPNFPAEDQEQVIHLAAEIVYNDGMGGGSIDHDWSHAVLSISTDIEIGNLTLRPDLNYQVSMDDSVNDEDELWCGLSIPYKF